MCVCVFMYVTISSFYSKRFTFIRCEYLPSIFVGNILLKEGSLGGENIGDKEKE